MLNHIYLSCSLLTYKSKIKAFVSICMNSRRLTFIEKAVLTFTASIIKKYLSLSLHVPS